MSSNKSTLTLSGEVSASGSGTGGRNKVALKPGKSLMDWIRFTHSGQDLTSVGGKEIEVSAKVLSQHNKKEDAWICLRGKVYNITPYLEYHPGGEDELMRGAGKDATDLFNQIHRWVNAESMLKKCYVGRMNMSSLWLQKATVFPAPKLPVSQSKITVVESDSKNEDIVDGIVEIAVLKTKEKKPQIPKYDWSQCEKSVSISIDAKEETIKLEDIIVDLVARDLFVVLHISSYNYSLHMELEGAVSPTYDVKIGKSNYATEIILSKDACEGQWEELGKPLNHHNTFVENIKKEVRFRPCKLLSKTPVAHNTFLFSFEMPSGTKMLVPLGHHVHLKACVDGMEIIRSYTPVFHSLDIPSSHSGLSEHQVLYLMIKIYPDGALTPVIDKCEIGNTLQISDYVGDFSLKSLQESSSLTLLAAGTGFTPMVKLIHWALELDKNQSRSVLLAFFNRTQKDILWKSELDSLCQKHSRFQVHYILSEPDEEWAGKKGRISRQMLQDLLPNSVDELGQFVYVCGPQIFTQLTLQYLSDLGYRKDSVHAFCG